MELLIGLIVIIPLLWLWLAGHWFGRVLAFLLFALAFGAGGATFILSIAPGSGPGGGGIYGFVVGAGLAWPVASWPLWHKRKLAQAAEIVAPKYVWTPSGWVQQVPRLIDRLP